MSAASCRKWWLEDILGSTDYASDDLSVSDADTQGLLFLPYLSGERSPHNDTKAKGAFIGLTSTTTHAQMSRAIMEGVAFALRDCLEIAKNSGIDICGTTICGGGSKGEAWRKIVSDVLNLPIFVQGSEYGPAFGASILAMTGCGEYPGVQTAIDKLVKVKPDVTPTKENVEKYNAKYALYKNLYPLLKDTFSKM